MKDRNAELKARQQSWVEAKQEALAGIKTGNMTAAQKQRIMGVLKSEHESIIRNHAEATAEIRDIELQAKAKGDSKLEEKSKTAAEESEKDDTSLGIFISLGAGTKGKSETSLEDESETELNSETEANVKVTSEEDAKAVVKKKLGFEASQVKTFTKGSTTFYVVTGKEEDTMGSFTMTKNFEAVVEGDNGLITSVDMSSHIESQTEASANSKESAEASGSGSAEAKICSKSREKLVMGIFG